MTKVKKSKKTYPIANKNLDIPEKTLLLGVLKEYKAYVDKLLAEIDDLKNKNKILIEKGKSLEKEKRELIESVALTKTEKKEVLRNVRKEELYKILVERNKVIQQRNKVLEEEKEQLIYKLARLQAS